MYFCVSLPVCWLPGKFVLVTPPGNPLTVTLLIFPALSHAFNSGLKVAPRKIVKIGSPAVVPRDTPFRVACGFALSVTLKFTSLLISCGA